MYDYLMNPYVIIPLVVWSLTWKGMALWKAAKNDSVPWFVALLLINTLGILEILYIYFPTKNTIPKDK
ncbi:MAG: DUF5652 family protein [bacterium]